MTSGQLLSLREKLSNFETETSHQIVVLTISNLGDDTIENYALEVFEQNQIGQEGEDNGVLILFSAKDREVRIEVGYGLEHILTDAISSRLIRNIMIPEFKESRYFEGMDFATDEIIRIIRNPDDIEEFADLDDGIVMMPFWGRLLIFILVGGFLSVFFFIGFWLLRKSYKDLVNAYRGLISGKISLVYFPFMLLGLFFILLFGLVFTLVPLFFFLMVLSIVNLNIDTASILDAIVNSGYINGYTVLMAICFFLLGLPLLIATLMVKRYNEGFMFSFLKSNKSFLKKNISFGGSTSSSRSSRSSGSSSFSSSSRSSSSSSRSSFSGGGGRSGGGGASGRW